MKKGKVNTVIAIVLTVTTLVVAPMMSYGHSGRTDSSGGHKDNKNKSGLGSYHYHCGGNPPHLHDSGVCPYGSGGSSESPSVSSESSGSSSSTGNSYSNPEPVVQKAIVFSSAPERLSVGEDSTANCSVSPSDSTTNTFNWSSSDESVVKVTEEGRVSAVGVGTAKITATSGQLSNSFDITVDEVIAESLAVKNMPSEITKGEEVSLEPEILPENTTDKALIWSSSDENIVTVDESGNIKAISPGKAIITVKQKDKSYEKDITVNPIYPESIEIAPVEEKIYVGKEVVLKASILPSDAEDKEVKWTVNDKSIANIENGVLKPKKSGKVIVEVETVNGKKDSIELTVESEASDSAGLGAGVLLVGGVGYGVSKYRKRKLNKK